MLRIIYLSFRDLHAGILGRWIKTHKKINELKKPACIQKKRTEKNVKEKSIFKTFDGVFSNRIQNAFHK